jgi:RNA polymerase sigma-70 factor (ECF subfamily)
MARLRISSSGEESRVGSLAKPDVDGADSAMQRYSAGDNAAFVELYDTIAPLLLGFLRKATRDGFAAEDLMQQTFLQIHRARGSFIPGAPVIPWALAIAKRLMIDRARRQRVELGIFVHAPAADDRVKSQATASAAPGDVLDARRLERRVQQRLDALPETQRTAYQLVKQEGLSLKRAAEVLGTSVTAVKLRTHRAYQALRAVLREEGVAP